MRATGAILIGGRSSRMGAPKHEIVLGDGRTMIEHVAEAMSRVCGRIVLVGAESHGLHALGIEVQVIADFRAAQGPLGGIEALLASDIDEHYVVCPCDVPRITAEALELLLRETAALATILRARGEETSPLPTRISARALPVVRELLDEGRRAVHQLHERIGAKVIDVPEEWGDLLTNVNTPEDLQRLR